MEFIHATLGSLLVIWLLASNTESVQESLTDLKAQLRFMAYHLHACEGESASSVFDLKLHHLSDANATCNDGSPAGYYLKKAHGSKRWLVYLEGGWFCFSRTSCKQREHSQMRNLMTSRHWPNHKRGSGMLSPLPDENPSWWNANHVLVPYCSSDAWSGNASSHQTGEKYSFLGARIIDKVIEDLMPRGLYHAKHLLLAGSSAGAIGVILNVDRISHKLRSRGSSVEVRGLADSGWYLDDSPSKPGCPKGVTDCGPIKTIKEGMKYWRGIVPDACARKHPSKPWKCYFGEVVYSHIKSPLFVFQWLYDEAQLALDGSIQPKSPQIMTVQQLSYIFKLGDELRESIKRANVSAVFSPACIYHTILTHNNWLKIHVNGDSLNDVLDCWFYSKDHHEGRAHCTTHRIDVCLYPLCNLDCPSPRNPFTGKQYPLKLPGKIPGIPLNPDQSGIRLPGHKP